MQKKGNVFLIPIVLPGPGVTAPPYRLDVIVVMVVTVVMAIFAYKSQAFLQQIMQLSLST